LIASAIGTLAGYTPVTPSASDLICNNHSVAHCQYLPVHIRRGGKNVLFVPVAGHALAVVVSADFRAGDIRSSGVMTSAALR
jgi:hypothetical protein